MTAQHGLDTGPETVNAADPRFTRPYDASEENVWTHRRTPDGWVDRDRDESDRWSYFGMSRDL